MRTGQFAPILALGIVTSILLVSAAATACNLSRPTCYPTDLYEKESRFIMREAGNAQGTAGALALAGQQTAAAAADDAGSKLGALNAYSSAAQGHIALCTESPVVPQAPGLPGVDWDPQPAADGNLAYANDQKDRTSGLVAAAQASPTTANGPAGAYISDSWSAFNTVFQNWQTWVFEPLLIDTAQGVALAIGAAGAEISAGGLPTAPSPDLEGAAGGDLSGVEALGDDGVDRAGCAAATPLPAL